MTARLDPQCVLPLASTPERTRRRAREKTATNAERHRQLLLAAFLTHGPMTADEAAARCGLLPLQARPRCTQLAQAGLIRATGIERPSALGNPATVYQAVTT